MGSRRQGRPERCARGLAGTLERHCYEMTMPKNGLILVAAVSVALAGCTNETTPSGMPMENSSASVSAGPGASAFNATDTTFVQMMLPHHDQAVSMSELLLDKRGVHPEVAALARQIRDGQHAEIETMNGWFEAMGRPQVEEGPHHGGLDGMLSEDEMQQLDQADARDGQRLFLEGMIKHHTGAIEMAQQEISGGQHQGVLGLAKQIAESQQQEIDTMTELLTGL
jgi:uncharacterized protein (DUF305 family)